MSIFDYMAYFHIIQIIKERPLDVNIETINMCPLKCIFCCNRLYKRERTVMDNVLFENIVKQYCSMGGGTLGIGSMQSDFLSDPLLIDRMKILKKYKKKLWIHSTTPIISCKKYSDKDLAFILHMFDYLVISVEGYDRESYKNMSGIDGFDILKEQLERIKMLKEKYALTVKTELAFRTYDKRNLRRSEFYKEARNTFYIDDIKDVFFSWFGSVKQDDLPEGAKLVLSYNHNKRKNCVVPNATLAVQANGKVIGCGCIDWLEKNIIGDCKKNTLKEIWKSSKAVKFRKAFENGKIPFICEECGLYTSIDSCMKDEKLLKYRSMDGLYYLVKRGR